MGYSLPHLLNGFKHKFVLVDELKFLGFPVEITLFCFW